MAMIISKNGRNALKVGRATFDKENELQEYIHNNPESVPIYEIKEEMKLLILAKEFETAAGPIDAVGVDQEGQIYLVETKLYKNPDKRQVVAQVLDYGAALWNSTGDGEFVAELDGHIRKTFQTGLAEKLRGFFGIDEESVDKLLENVRQNFLNGAFRFVVLMDSLSDSLKKLVLFINKNSQFDLFAVEMEYYKYEEFEIIIPRLYGTEVKKTAPASASSSQRRRWDEESFRDDARQRLNDGQFNAVEELYKFSKEKADLVAWGTGAVCGSFNPKFSKISERSLFSVYTDGTLRLNFGWLTDNDIAKEYRHKFAQEMAKAKGFELPKNCEETHVEFNAEIWGPVVPEFTAAVNRLLEK